MNITLVISIYILKFHRDLNLSVENISISCKCNISGIIYDNNNKSNQLPGEK